VHRSSSLQQMSTCIIVYSSVLVTVTKIYTESCKTSDINMDRKIQRTIDKLTACILYAENSAVLCGIMRQKCCSESSKFFRITSASNAIHQQNDCDNFFCNQQTDDVAIVVQIHCVQCVIESKLLDTVSESTYCALLLHQTIPSTAG